MIDGCLDWQVNGLQRPQIVRTATEAYFSEQDLFGQWLEEECDVDIANRNRMATTLELFASWSAFAKAAGEEPGTAKSFAPAMRRKGFKPYKTKIARGWRGIRLQGAQADFGG